MVFTDVTRADGALFGRVICHGRVGSLARRGMVDDGRAGVVGLDPVQRLAGAGGAAGDDARRARERQRTGVSSVVRTRATEP